jgi:aminoglycoside 3-N-acetyltransferase
VKQHIKRFVPTPLISAYNQLRKHRAAHQRRTRRNAAKELSGNDLNSIFAKLGIQRGDNLIVHSALGQFNNVDGGPQGVLAAIWDVIGRAGTLMVPTFPHWITTMRSMRPFDIRNTPSEVGVLTEVVRLDPRSHRSIHPTHSVACIGPLSAEFTEAHQRGPYAFGIQSPFFRHAIAGGKILLIGVDLNSLTAFHIYEDLIAPTPWLPVYETKMRSFEIISPDCQSSFYSGYFHSLETANARNVESLRPALEAAAKLRNVHTDFSHVSLLDSKATITVCLQELAAGRTAYGPITVPPGEMSKIDRALKMVS